MGEQINIPTKTISPHFFDDEILHHSIDDKGRKTLYLKQGVKRWPKVFENYWDEEEHKVSYINKQRLFWDKVENITRIKQQETNFDD